MMNEHHKKLIEKDLTKKEVWDIGNKAIEDYARGYVSADKESCAEKTGYFSYMIEEVARIINERVY